MQKKTVRGIEIVGAVALLSLGVLASGCGSPASTTSQVPTKETTELAAGEQALKELKSLDAEYEDYVLAESSTVPPIDSVSVSTVGGLQYVTKYVGGRVGAVRISKEDQDKLKKVLLDSVQEALKHKQEPTSNWRLLVVCPKATGATPGGGAVWFTPSLEKEEDLKGAGVYVGSGASVRPVVRGSLCVLDTERKLLLHHKTLYASGRDANAALRGFGDNVAAGFTAWVSGRR